MIKRYLFILSSLLFLAGIFFVALNNNAIGVSLYCAGGKECAPTFAFEESGDQTKYKPAEPNKYCNNGQCITKWLKQSDLPLGKNGFCVGGICLKDFKYPKEELPPPPGLNFTINGQKGVMWIPAESDIHLKWNISPPAQEVSLSCTGDCPELNDINNGIKTAYARRGTVSVNWNTAESTWTLRAIRDSATINETITVIPKHNEASEWKAVPIPFQGNKVTRSDGIVEYRQNYIWWDCVFPQTQPMTMSACMESQNPTCFYSDGSSGSDGGGVIMSGGTPKKSNRYAFSWRGGCSASNVGRFDFMKLADYNEALNRVTNGPGIMVSFKGSVGHIIETKREFQHYFGPPPCIDKNYNLDFFKGTSLFQGGISLTPAYKCGAAINECTDYNPVCDGRDMQQSWEERSPGLWPNCTLTGLKSRIVRCYGKEDGDIRWSEGGNYNTQAGLDIVADFIVQSFLAFIFPGLTSEWSLKPATYEIPLDPLKCPPGKCTFIEPVRPPPVPTPVPPAIGAGKNLSNNLLVGIGGADNEANTLVVRTAEEEARRGQTRISPESPYVVSNTGNLRYDYAVDIVQGCKKNKNPEQCKKQGAANAPRVRYIDAQKSPPQGY